MKDLLRGWGAGVAGMLVTTFAYSIVVAHWVESTEGPADANLGEVLLYGGLGSFLMYLLPTLAAAAAYPRGSRYGVVRWILGIALIPLLVAVFEIALMADRVMGPGEFGGDVFAVQAVFRVLGCVVGTVLAWVFLKSPKREEWEL